MSTSLFTVSTGWKYIFLVPSTCTKFTENRHWKWELAHVVTSRKSKTHPWQETKLTGNTQNYWFSNDKRHSTHQLNVIPWRFRVRQVFTMRSIQAYLCYKPRIKYAPVCACVRVCQWRQQSMAYNISTCIHKFKYYCYCLICAAFYFISIFYFIVSLYAVLWSHPLSMVSFTLSIAVVLQWKWFINHTLTTHYKQHKFSSTKKNMMLMIIFHLPNAHVPR